MSVCYHRYATVDECTRPDARFAPYPVMPPSPPGGFVGCGIIILIVVLLLLIFKVGF